MNIDQAFPSKYLKSDDIARPIKVFIAGVTIEEIEDGKNKKNKPVLHFRPNQNLPNHEHPSMVLNLTNSNMIKTAYGSDTDAWVGHEVGLWVDPNIQFAGNTVKGLRIKIFETEPKFAEAPVVAAQPAPAPIPNQTAATADFQQPASEPDFDDDIPF